MNAFDILVIILSIFLAIFLIVATITGILLIRVTMQIRKVTATAEKTAVNLEAFTANLTDTASKVAIGKMLFTHLKKMTKTKRK